MFSIVNAVLLRPLPYPHADRLGHVWGKTPAFPRGLLSYHEYEEIRSRAARSTRSALFFPQSVNLTGVDEPQRLVGTFATGIVLRRARAEGRSAAASSPKKRARPAR